MKVKPILFNFSVLLLILPFDSVAQIPNRAITIADSICKTQLICSNSWVEFKNSIFYPKESSERDTEIYYFSYEIYIKDDISTSLYISIKENFSIEYINGIPNNNYEFSPCEIQSREKLWEIAKNNGLKIKYKRCRYNILFEEDGIYIDFYERKRHMISYYTVNAISGEYIGKATGTICVNF
ncbi:MAG: hypothetical protein K0B10_12685 [Vicingaceae bacterium]|nr:hypothetical protein [Vicingaceae bacterium]